MADPGHQPVLLRETLELLALTPGERAVDGTAGRGGHALAMSAAVGPKGVVVGFDLDAGNLAYAAERVREAGGRFEAIHANFARMPEEFAARGLAADAVLLDLGFASTQMDEGSRGLSFQADAPLDMRFDRSRGPTAAELVASLSEADLADVIFRYGEDPFARRIARKLAQERRRGPIDTTEKLARAVREAYGHHARRSRLDPATRTFMALRIATNDEIGSLERFAEATLAEARRIRAGGSDGWLRAGARIAIVAFHSLEDRIVKHAFRDAGREGLLDVLTKKPVTASEAEVEVNRRARSAKLRAARIAAHNGATGAERPRNTRAISDAGTQDE